MAILIKRFYFTRLNELLFLNLIIAIAISILNPIWPLYFNTFFNNNSLVGAFSSILSMVALVSFFIFTPIIEKYSERKIYLYGLLISILILILLAFNESFYFFVILILIYVMVSVLRAESFGIIYREESKIKTLGKNEGLLYLLSNIGWLIGALFVIILLSAYNFKIIFLFSALFTFLASLIFLLYRKNIKKKYKNINFLINIKNFLKNKELSKLYISSLGTSIWLGFIFIYIPLYIVENGFDKSFVGIFLFVFLIPYLIEYFVGKKSDIVGTKFFIVSGYFLMGLFTILAYFIDNIYLILFFLVLGSFGVSFTAPTREVHFFKIIKKVEEEHYYGIFLTHMEVGLLLGKIIPAILLLFFNFKIVFLVIGVTMFLFFLYSFKLKNI